jgi:chaperonin GroES
MDLKMFGDKLLLEKPVVEKKEERTAAGLYIPQMAKNPERVVWAKVLVVGNEAKNVKVGDNVLYDSLASFDVTIDGVTYAVMREQDLIGASIV